MFTANQNDLPGVLGEPISTNIRVQATSSWLDAVGDDIVRYAQAILSNNAGVIHSYVTGQQLISKNVRFWVNEYKAPSWSARYIKNGTQQSLELVLYPQNVSNPPAPLDIEINLDGYIFWMQTWFPSYNPPNFSGTITYDFLLNDVSLYTYTGSIQSNSGILFKFGSTALRCQSLIDKTKADPNEPGNPNTPLTNAILPPRNPIKTFNNVLAGNPNVIDTHPDLPGYFIYNAKQPLVIGGFPVYSDDDVFTIGHETVVGVNPTIIKTVNVDPNSNPLIQRGLNKFRVKLSPSSPFSDGWSAGYDMRAEFYSRFSMRPVTQSWTKSGGTIQVNDQPLFWRMGSGAFPTQAMDVDLTPKSVDQTVPTPQTNPVNAWNADDDLLTQWSALACRGYWRPGDPPASQPVPPNDPWALTVQVCIDACEAWYYLIYTMCYVTKIITFNENPVPPPGEPSNVRVNFGVPMYGLTFKAKTPLEQSMGATWFSPLLPFFNGNYTFPTNRNPNVVGGDDFVTTSQQITIGPASPAFSSTSYYYGNGGNGPGGAQGYIQYTTTDNYPYDELISMANLAISQLDEMVSLLAQASDDYTNTSIYFADPNALSVAQQADESLSLCAQTLNTLYPGGTATVTINGTNTEYLNTGTVILPYSQNGSVTTTWGIAPQITAARDDGLATVTEPWVSITPGGPQRYAPQLPVFGLYGGQSIFNPASPDDDFASAIALFQTPVYMDEQITGLVGSAKTTITQLQNLLQAMDNYITP